VPAQRGTLSLLRSTGEHELIGADRIFFRNHPTRQGKGGLSGSRANRLAVVSFGIGYPSEHLVIPAGIRSAAGAIPRVCGV